ncbi:hypothetical protein JNB63_14150 [Microbacterium trichothecenolyticum]|uniref:hypothetical protein n=1 Tax=Microbacterium trichothecenolyticum TaxID=69370 RepID=UPI001C6F3A52|nr:hypothetical protein [Microbacterium trichothecenolyticum]MBW9121237.1 hypothetical protein [Microbacterium trichothecenolyticum]
MDAADDHKWFPWAISAIAKESVLRGNEYRHAEIDNRRLSKLVHLLNSSSDVSPGQSAASLLTPIMYEQFPYQESAYEEMARTHALLVYTEPGESSIPWDEVLGVGLDEAVRASHVLHAWVVNNAGRFDPRILDMPHFQEIYHKVAPRAEIEAAAKLLTADIPSLRDARREADERASLPSRLERYAYNPLKSQPLVDLGREGIWAPQTMLVSRAFLGANLYYRGLARWGKPFADELGDRTQRYVGRQLSLLDGVVLYPEIEYSKSQRSVDWIWVSDAAVILVECKAARLSLDAQAGGDSLAGVMGRYLGAARDQIDRTAGLIRADHSAFDHIPKDRPIVGLVTTAEQFYLAGTPFSGFQSSGAIPAATASLRDLEFLVGLPERDAAHLVIDHAHPNGEGGRFGGAFSDSERKRRNPILEEAWSHFDLLTDMDQETADSDK